MSKVCTKCGVEKDFSEYSKDVSGKYGLRAACKACRNAEHALHRQIRVDREKAQVKREVAARREPVPVEKLPVTPPPTYTTLKDPQCWTGWKEPQFIRNDGLKHVPSRGFV